MGKGDRRHSNKMRRRKSQEKLKTRVKRRAATVKEARAAVAKPVAEKKRSTRARTPAAG